MFGGYLLGLHADNSSSRADCPECAKFGDDLGKINLGLVLVETRKDAWFNKN